MSSTGEVLERVTGAEFKMTREKMGISQDWMCRYLNVSRQSIKGWERDDWEPPAGVVTEVGYLVDEFNAEIEKAVARVGDGILEVPYSDDDSPDSDKHEPFPAMFWRMVAARVSEQTGARVEYL